VRESLKNWFLFVVGSVLIAVRDPKCWPIAPSKA
jgi:hypothetical protein